MTTALKAAVGCQSWDWLGAIARQLRVAVEILDPGGAACLPAEPDEASPVAGGLRAALQSPAFRVLAAKARRSGHCEDSIEALALSLSRLQTDSAATGLLVIGRDRALSASTDAELGAIGSWLRPAVEAQLSRAAQDHVDGFDRVSSLHHLLQDIVDLGGEREVVTAFAEALFAWDGVEASGYVEDIDGGLVLVVATPGAERGHACVPDAGPRPSSLTRLSAGDLERFGFAGHRQVLAAEIAGGTLDPWLLLVAEGFGSLDPARLTLYVELLRECLGRAAIIHETRATWAIMQQLLGAANGAEPAIAAALVELRSAVPATAATLVVVASSGVTVLTAGDGDRLAAPPAAAVRPLVSSRPVADHYTMTISLQRAAGHAFTRREQHLVERAAEVFAAWLPGMLRQAATPFDRRAEHREFEQVLDRAALQAVREGTDVSMVVISAPDAACRPGLLHTLVADIRGRLRGSDLAGALSDREIGVLLSGTSAEHVPVVCQRFRQSLTRSGAPAAAIGSASRTPAQNDVDSLVAAARLSARSRSEMIGRPA